MKQIIMSLVMLIILTGCTSRDISLSPTIPQLAQRTGFSYTYCVLATQ